VAGPFGIGEVRDGVVYQCRPFAQPPVVPGELIKREQPGRQGGVIFQDGCTVADPAAEAGPPQQSADDVQFDQRPGTCRCSRT
jgi:hypothetical protein